MGKSFIKNIPIINKIAIKLYSYYLKLRFPGSEKYWSKRYAKGGISGAGRYKDFKAQILNEFVKKHEISTVIEYGCGDGNQLKLGMYPKYLGFDVSPQALTLCKALFSSDDSKEFKLMNDYAGERAELTLSLDVIYHLIEDEIYDAYMKRLFSSSDNYVIIYSTNTDVQPKNRAPHVRHRKFTDWVEANTSDWKLTQQIFTHQYFPSRKGSERFRDFFIFEKTQKNL